MMGENEIEHLNNLHTSQSYSKFRHYPIVRKRMSATDFIEVYEGALSADFCAEVITRFEHSDKIQPGRVGGGVFPDLKHSRDISINNLPEWADVVTRLNDALIACLRKYLRSFPYTLIAPLMLETRRPDGTSERLTQSSIQSMDEPALTRLIFNLLRPGEINLQTYSANQGGYPYWHCELYPKDASAESLHRTLLWTAYLNDDFAEGETEFLYQQRKIKPKTGSILIAPTAFTHTHRGNRPLQGDKFIATSWVLFQRAEKIFGPQS
jgi:2OG-Fe(II) oxygenase superfamily